MLRPGFPSPLTTKAPLENTTAAPGNRRMCVQTSTGAWLMLSMSFKIGMGSHITGTFPKPTGKSSLRREAPLKPLQQHHQRKGCPHSCGKTKVAATNQVAVVRSNVVESCTAGNSSSAEGAGCFWEVFCELG